jgi:uncharacterized membrane protein YdbT with pleckstrin-like domain
MLFRNEGRRMSDEVVALLGEVPVFSQVSRDDLAALAAAAEQLRASAGSQPYRQAIGEPAACLVASGRVRVLQVDGSGVETEVRRSGPGDFFGEPSLLLGEPCEVTLEAIEDAEVVLLKKQAFDRLLLERPGMLEQLQVQPDMAQRRRAKTFGWQDPDEVVFIHLRKHPLFLVTSLVLPGLAAAIVISGEAYSYWVLDRVGWIVYGGAFVGALLLLYAAYVTVDYLNDNYVVTNKRVVHEENVPIIRESRNEAALANIQDVKSFRQGVLSQMYNLGDLEIETAGESGSVVFRQIADPGGVREAIFVQIEKARARAKASGRAAIRDSLESHLAQEKSEPRQSQLEVPLAIPSSMTSSGAKPSWLIRGVRYFWPPRREQNGDTITWRKHWTALVRPIWLPTCLIVAASVLAFWALRRDFDAAAYVLVAYATLLGFLLPWWLWQYEDWRNDVYQVTPTRIVDIERITLSLREERREASLDRIQNINLEIPSFLGKLFNVGSVTIETAGAGAFTFTSVHDPRSVQADVFRSVEAFRKRREQEDSDHRKDELLDWFSVYDQMKSAGGTDRGPESGAA